MSQEIEASRETDERIAVEVMGDPRPEMPTWAGDADLCFSPVMLSDSWGLSCNGYENGDEPMIVPRPFSTDRGAAIEVIDKLTDARLDVAIELERYGDGRITMVTVDPRLHRGYGEVKGPTASALPLAICRAALSPAVLDYLKSRAPLGGA